MRNDWYIEAWSIEGGREDHSSFDVFQSALEAARQFKDAGKIVRFIAPDNVCQEHLEQMVSLGAYRTWEDT